MTRVLAEAAIEKAFDVLTSENHGMAMRGGTVISHIKIGDFKSPLIRCGQADLGLFINRMNLDIHGDLMKSGGEIFVNTTTPGDYRSIDAVGLAKKAGSPVVANLVLLGYAVKGESLFCSSDVIEKVIRRISQPRQLDLNLKGFQLGLGIN